MEMAILKNLNILTKMNHKMNILTKMNYKMSIFKNFKNLKKTNLKKIMNILLIILIKIIFNKVFFKFLYCFLVDSEIHNNDPF